MTSSQPDSQTVRSQDPRNDRARACAVREIGHTSG